jgi:hypothetical protein
VRTIKAFWGSLIIIFCLGVMPAYAQTPLQARVRYEEINTGAGSWSYDFWFYNDVDPLQVGYDIVGMDLFASPAATISVSNIAPDWDGAVNSGTISFLSLSVGTPPTGSDIPPSAFLGGFRVQFANRPGDLPFTALFNDPADPTTPLTFSGMTALQIPSNVPEPGAIALLISASLSGGGFLLRRCRR